MLGEDVGRKQIDLLRARWTGNGLHPKKIQDICLTAVREPAPIVRPDTVGHVSLDVMESRQDYIAIMQRKSISHKKMSNRINVSADCASPKFQRFADGCTAPHEGVEDDRIGNAGRLIEQTHHVRPTRSKSAQHNRAECRPQPVGPPLVNVVERPVYLLAPALDLANVAQALKGKRLVLDRPSARPWRDQRAVLLRISEESRRDLSISAGHVSCWFDANVPILPQLGFSRSRIRFDTFQRSGL